MHFFPLYNVLLNNVFLPTTFDSLGPEEDFDLPVKVCAVCPVQCKTKSRKREEKQQERMYIDRALVCSAMQSPEPLTVYIGISKAIVGRRRINHRM